MPDENDNVEENQTETPAEEQAPDGAVDGVEEKKEENAYVIKEHNDSLDFVFSSHCLEHLKNWEKALKEWHRVLKSGGIIFLYLPHSSCEMWLPGVNKYHKWSPEPKIVSEFLEKELKMQIREITYLPDAFMSFVIVAEK